MVQGGLEEYQQEVDGADVDAINVKGSDVHYRVEEEGQGEKSSLY